jgi:hypothetical protein
MIEYTRTASHSSLNIMNGYQSKEIGKSISKQAKGKT